MGKTKKARFDMLARATKRSHFLFLLSTLEVRTLFGGACSWLGCACCSALRGRLISLYADCTRNVRGSDDPWGPMYAGGKDGRAANVRDVRGCDSHRDRGLALARIADFVFVRDVRGPPANVRGCTRIVRGRSLLCDLLRSCVSCVRLHLPL